VGLDPEGPLTSCLRGRFAFPWVDVVTNTMDLIHHVLEAHVHLSETRATH